MLGALIFCILLFLALGVAFTLFFKDVEVRVFGVLILLGLAALAWFVVEFLRDPLGNFSF